MERLSRVISSDKYIHELERIKSHEKGREFCGHDMEHFIAVGRILYIMCLEEGIDVDKEIAYSIGMLHDIGRGEEYDNGKPHNLASMPIAEELMKDAGFSQKEVNIVLKAIESHRELKEDGSDIERLTFKADKASRECWVCPVAGRCKWKHKNEGIRF